MPVSFDIAFEAADMLANEEMDQVIALFGALSSRPIERLDVIETLTRSRLFLAYDGKRIVGMAVLATYRKLGGTVGVIEEVVVDEGYRGRSIGTGLMAGLIAYARRLGVTQLELTTRPAREEANALYESLGFVHRDTNCYRLIL